jgi:hypothetical protein
MKKLIAVLGLVIAVPALGWLLGPQPSGSHRRILRQHLHVSGDGGRDRDDDSVHLALPHLQEVLLLTWARQSQCNACCATSQQSS